jgi:uncharacterized membrane protein
MIALATLDSLGDLDAANVSIRWIHVLAGVLWIGMLWFFNFVNAALMPTLDAETKRKVVPELMPRALFWFRWGAAFTWLSGVFLLMLLYYAGPYLFAPGTELAGTKPALMDWLPAFGALIVGFLVYDILFKTLGKAQHALAVVIWGAIAVGFGFALERHMSYSGRAVLIHVAALFGTAMAANVWMRIWPAQKRIITAVKAGSAPNPADPALAGLRSKHNTYMSVSLLLFMVSVHMTGMIGFDPLAGLVAGVLAIAWVITWLVYKMVPSVKGF